MCLVLRIYQLLRMWQKLRHIFIIKRFDPQILNKRAIKHIIDHTDIIHHV